MAAADRGDLNHLQSGPLFSKLGLHVPFFLLFLPLVFLSIPGPVPTTDRAHRITNPLAAQPMPPQQQAAGTGAGPLILLGKGVGKPR